MKPRKHTKEEFVNIDEIMKSYKLSESWDEIVYIGMSDEWKCTVLPGPSHIDAIKQQHYIRLGWYATLDLAHPDYEYVGQTTIYPDSAVLAIPRRNLTVDNIDDINGSYIEDVTGMAGSKAVDLYNIFNEKSVIQPEEPPADHKHKWITLYPVAGSGDRDHKSERCAHCDIVREHATWKHDCSNGSVYDWVTEEQDEEDMQKNAKSKRSDIITYDWTAYRYLTPDEVDSLQSSSSSTTSEKGESLPAREEE